MNDADLVMELLPPTPRLRNKPGHRKRNLRDTVSCLSHSSQGIIACATARGSNLDSDENLIFFIIPCIPCILAIESW